MRSQCIPGIALVSIVAFIWLQYLDVSSHSFTQVAEEPYSTHDVPSLMSLSLHNILFVHIGKAGGNTFRVIFKGYCSSDRLHIPDACDHIPESALADRVSGYAHDENYHASVDEADAFLYNLRHPVDRMISWYNYEHPKSCMHNRQTKRACATARHIKKHPGGSSAKFFNDCFPTQEHLPLLASKSAGSDTVSQACSDLAKEVIAGERYGKGFKHMYYNMEHYTNRTIDKYPDKSVLVVRTESLWDDIKELDIMLGGKGTFGGIEGTRDSHGSEKYKKSNGTLSVTEYGILCCAIEREMNIYRHLLELAVNFDDKATKDTITRTANKCGFSSWDEMMSTCSGRQH